MIVMFLLVMARKYNNALYGKKNIYIYQQIYIIYITYILQQMFNIHRHVVESLIIRPYR